MQARINGCGGTGRGRGVATGSRGARVYGAFLAPLIFAPKFMVNH
jgi:hypothetical protein